MQHHTEGSDTPPSPPPRALSLSLPHQCNSFNTRQYDEIKNYKARPTDVDKHYSAQYNRNKENKGFKGSDMVPTKPIRQPMLPHDINPVELLYKLSNRSSNDGDSITSYKSDISKANHREPSPQYVEMGRSLFDMWDDVPPPAPPDREIPPRKVLPFYPAEIPSNGKRSTDRMIRRYTTEYRAPPQLVLPPLKNDSSDSAERSPVATPASKSPYPYLVLTERAKKKKKTSITSSTSEDNSDAVAVRLRAQANEWREHLSRRGIDTQTVDRRQSKKHASKSAKMKRQGSFNIDPAGEFHLSLDVQRSADTSASVRSCNRSPVLESRRTPLQISAEDMVQIANCGARNKNGSLCHFISTADTDNYLSISQALLNQSSGSEAKIADNDTLTRKRRTLERKKKSTHSLAFESSDETLRRRDKPAPLKDRREDKMLATMKRENDAKGDTVERRHKPHARQRSHDAAEKSIKTAKYAQETNPTSGRKLVHAKSEGQRNHNKIPPGYFLLEDENGHTVPLRLPDAQQLQQKEMVKYQSPSVELLDKRSIADVTLHHKEACKCLIQSNHSLIKGSECNVYREKSDFSSDTDPGNPAFRRLGTSSREDMTNSGGDVEESFDF